jgi:hypothetical protein
LLFRIHRYPEHQPLPDMAAKKAHAPTSDTIVLAGSTGVAEQCGNPDGFIACSRQ